jgi:hypothetical protein
MKPMDGALAHPLLGFDGEEKGGRDLPDSITCAGGESLSPSDFHDILGSVFAISRMRRSCQELRDRNIR